MSASANTSSVEFRSEDSMAAKKQVMVDIKEAYLKTQANQTLGKGWEILPDEVSDEIGRASCRERV